MASFLGEIRRRKVFQVAVVYAVVAWLLVQIVATVEEPLGLPAWFDTGIIVLLAVGFPIALILSWAFDITPEGIRSAADVPRPAGSVTPGGQQLGHIMQALVLLAVAFLVADQYLLGSRDVPVAPSPAARSETINRFTDILPIGRRLRRIGRLAFALSPDGRHFVYNTPDGLYLRRMNELEARPIAGTQEDLSTPFFSPDGQYVGYWAASGELKRVSIMGGTPVPVASDVANLNGASWGLDDMILFGQADGIYRVPAEGGVPERIIDAPGDGRVSGPVLLPDGASIMFTEFTSSNQREAQIIVWSEASGARSVILEGGVDGRYASTGHLFYAVNDVVFVVDFDLANLTASGGAVPVVQNVMRAESNIPSANYGVSNDGTLAYVSSGGAGTGVARRILWADRGGREEAIPVEPGEYLGLRMSPDKNRVVLDARNPNYLWIWDFEAGIRSGFGVNPFGDSPVWTPDGDRIAYHPGSGIVVGWRPANNTGGPSTAADLSEFSLQDTHPFAFASPTVLIFGGQAVEGSGEDIGIIDVELDAEPSWPIAGPGNQRNAALSSNRNWIAYESDHSGQNDIYVRSFPNVDNHFLTISDTGGVEPLWSASGLELYWLETPTDGPTRLMSVTIELDADGEPAARNRGAILDWPYWVSGGGVRHSYDVSEDGERFLAMREVDSAESHTADEAATRIVIVQNWLNALRPSTNSD